MCCFACNFVNIVIIIWQWVSETETERDALQIAHYYVQYNDDKKKVVYNHFLLQWLVDIGYIHLTFSLFTLIRVFLYKMEYKKARLHKKNYSM